MTWVPPLLVAIPLLGAAVVAGGDHVIPSPVQDALGVLAAAATTALAGVLLARTGSHDVVHWFGGWRPRHGLALGVDFAVGPLAAGMCVVVGAAVLLSLVYSLTYLKEAARLFDTLMLVALGAMCGFAMSGDLFNLFVWLELMGVAAYALTGFQADQLGPVQGAVNFAITNTVGSFLLVTGIALVYARTGALNLAQAGVVLRGHGGGDGLVVVAMTLVLCGFLVKGAVVPFHLWAADAYAVAPAPVCAVLGGVMTDIGLFGVARAYWTVFHDAFPASSDAGAGVLLWLGIATALLAGVMTLLQRHLKRLLAYSVVSHIGIMLAGIGLVAGKGLAGSAVMFTANALLTVAAFLVAGILLAEHETIDELRLRGRGGRAAGAIWLAAALGLVGAPYLGVYLGHGLIDEAAAATGRHWVPPLLWLASALVGASLLRAWGRIFLGLGAAEEPLLGRELEEEPPTREVARPLLLGVAATALAAGLVVSVLPGIAPRAEQAADRFRDRAAYAAVVLRGVERQPAASAAPATIARTSAGTVLYGAAALLAAAALAALALHRPALSGRLGPAPARVLTPPVVLLKAAHSGVVGDYVAWVLVGTAVTGGAWALLLR